MNVTMLANWKQSLEKPQGAISDVSNQLSTDSKD